MKINNNISAVVANVRLLRTENKLTAAVERLSSGYKINKPGDNPSGMAISNKMRQQIAALDQAETNANNAVSTLQIADGALGEVSDILQRIRELSVQAANGTNSYSDRQSMQAEIDELIEEVDRISSDTEYNTKTLLNGSSDVCTYSDQVSRIYTSSEVTAGIYEMTVTEMAETASYTFTTDQLDNANASGTITINDVTMNYSSGMSEEAFYEELRNTAEEAGCVATRVTDDDGNVTGYSVETMLYGSASELRIEVSGDLAVALGLATSDGDTLTATADGAEVDEDGEYVDITTYGKDAVIDLLTTAETNDDGESGIFSLTATAADVDGLHVKISDLGGFSMDFLLDESLASGDTVDIEVTDMGGLVIQIGANQYQTMTVRIPEVSSETLYLDTVDVTQTGGPERAMNTLDDAIAKLNSVRSGIGAYQNRLEYAASSLSETSENVTSAYSGLTDTDMAEEMTEYTQQSILEQAAISVLGQANDLPQEVLSLLR